MAFDKYGYICPFNNECRCQVADCDYCGWNPEVSERRLDAILKANQYEEDTTVKKIVNLEPIIKELADWCLVSKGLECRTLGIVIDKLRAAPAVEIPKWISVSDRLPKIGETVLVCDANEGYVNAWEYCGLDEWLHDSTLWLTEDITHWMPLPEPPGVSE